MDRSWVKPGVVDSTRETEQRILWKSRQDMSSVSNGNSIDF